MRTTRPRVTDNSFDVASTSQPQPSGSCSRLFQASQAYDEAELEVPEACVTPEVQEQADLDAPLKSYLEGAFDTLLLYNYAKHAARHVWH